MPKATSLLSCVWDIKASLPTMTSRLEMIVNLRHFPHLNFEMNMFKEYTIDVLIEL